MHFYAVWGGAAPKSYAHLLFVVILCHNNDIGRGLELWATCPASHLKNAQLAMLDIAGTRL